MNPNPANSPPGGGRPPSAARCAAALQSLAALVVLGLAACTGAEPAAPARTGDAHRSGSPTAPADVVVADWTLPAPDGAAQPDLVATPDGALLLSWIEPDGKGHALKFARYAGDAWSAPAVIARGDDWFVNWADTPHLAATADGALWAHWLQKSAAATYAYDVAVVRSSDGGASWSAPVLANDDGTPTEHGFVSMWADSADSIGVAWLDGRNTGGGDGHGGEQGHGAGMMTLRSARFDAGLARLDDTELDASACDCCQTDSALTDRGRIVAYRDRTPAEIRDIYTVRRDGAGWSRPRRVHADDWTMPACPVNGPAIDARGSDVVVAWYTAAGDAANPGAAALPRVRIAHSGDGGDSFAPPRVLDAGEHVQGRVDVAMGGDAAWALWLREDGDGQSLQLARLSPDLAGDWQRLEVARVAGRGRATGFAQLVLVGDRAHVAWTEVVEGRPRLRGAILAPPSPPAAASTASRGSSPSSRSSTD